MHIYLHVNIFMYVLTMLHIPINLFMTIFLCVCMYVYKYFQNSLLLSELAIYSSIYTWLPHKHHEISQSSLLLLSSCFG
jgi:hypothetical protein